MERLGRLLRAAGLTLLGLTAALGVSLAAAGLLASSGPGSRRVAGWLAGALEGLVAGRITAGGVTIHPGGDVELRDLELADPSGRPVIRVARAHARFHLEGLARRTVGIELELDRPEVILEPGQDGVLTIAAALAAAGAPDAAPPGAASGGGWRGWTIRVARLRLHEASVTWRGSGERTWLEARGVELVGAGLLGARGISAGLEVAGKLEVPLEGTLSIELVARIEGSRLTVPRLQLGAASSRLEAFGEWDWSQETFRAAAARLALAEKDLAAVAGRRVAGGDLEGRIYAESDGQRLTAAVELDGPGGSRGGGRAALAIGLGGGSPRSIGFDVVLDQLDPARLLSRAPAGRISVAGRGGLRWPVQAVGSAGRGQVTVDRLAVALPGLELRGSGRWADAGAMSAGLRATVSDLGAAGPAVAALVGVALPALTGQAEASLELAGTAAAPEAKLAIQTPGLTVAGTPIADGRAELRLSGEAVELEASTALEPLGGAVVAVDAAASLAPGWTSARLSRLEVEVASQGWALAAPANLAFGPASVDRAELRSGSQRVVVSGGSVAGGAVDLKLEVSGLELARLPRGLWPESLGLAGRGEGRLHLAGTDARRTLEARLGVAGGELATLSGLELHAELAWRRQSGRASLEATLRRAEGGTLDLSADLPWPLDGPPGRPATCRVAAGGWPLRALLRALGVELEADGGLGGELTLTGSAGSPQLEARASLSDGRWAGAGPLGLTARLVGAGPALRAEAELTLAATALARASAELPFERGALLAHPGRTLGRLADAAWSGRMNVPGVELDSLAGTAKLPAGITGRVVADASIAGTPAAPRGTVSASLTGVALGGSPTLDGHLSVALEPVRTAVTALLTSGGAPALQLSAAVAAPVEQLGRDEVQRRAPLELSATVPQLTLRGEPGRRWSLAGLLEAKLEANGTLAAPRGTLVFDLSGLTLGGQAFGDLAGTVRTDQGRTTLQLAMDPVEGGTLRCEGTLGAVPGVQSTATALATAPLQLAVKGDGLGVGFLPPLLPGTLRAATGTLETELTVTGSPRAPRLAGTMALTSGTVTLPGWGTFTGVAFRATLDPRSVRLEGLSAQRGEGKLEGWAAVEGLDGAEPRLAGSLRATAFTLARALMDVATIDATATLGGRYRDRRVEVEVAIERGGAVRLPRKAPRALQPIEDRPDVVIGEEPPAPAGSPASGAATGEPALAVSLRVRGEGLLLKSDQPRVHVELRTDSTWDVTASPLQVAGTLDAGQGSFEPLAGRLFKVVRGHVGFTGGPLGEAQLDLAADYETATAKVHATISGTIHTPNLRLTSEPPLDEASLAMLIVTGRTEMGMSATQTQTQTQTQAKAQASAFTAQDAGMAAAMAVANKVFEDQLGEKMPLDTLTLDSGAMTAGKQLTDRVFVGYVRRFDARPEKGENADEVQVQYHLSPRWTLESRYGNAGAGGASIMWQKDF